jgi:FKBP-type peptidyl-prolyl cis-trans isomerase FklB
VSYIIGYDLGKNFKTQGIEINSDILLAGILQGMTQAKQLITDQESEKVLAVYVAQINEKKQAAQQDQISKTKQAGEAFLLANKKKAGVITTASGLQYKVIREGTGASPKLTDKVMVHYAGRLIDGTKFDASYDWGTLLNFRLTE